MKNKIIKSKRTNDGVVELIEHKDEFGKIIKYEITFGHMAENVIGGGVGELV